mgnify:CR=1 FL=1
MDWELAGFTDEEGRLRADIPEQQGIIVCPNVELQGDKIVFHTPDNWKKPISALDKGIYDFLDAGWQKREDTSGLLGEVLKLVNASPRRILSFAKKWGPLWVCCEEWHNEEYGEDIRHYWTPENYWKTGEDLSCQWAGVERVQDYVNFSKDVSTILNMSASIKQNKPVSSQLWSDFFGFEDTRFEMQKLVIRSFLESLVANVSLRITPDLRLQFATGFGFRAAVFLQLIQVITGTPGLFTCDGCGKQYIRTGRKPAAGRRNFCPECGEGGKGSKRLYKRGRPKKPVN